jgi:hypothetical protein
VPPYEVTKIARAAGFSPLAPPMREGTNYVLRATDHRGILMRVVVDARSGAVRAVNRIVPAGPYGPVGMMAPPPYDDETSAYAEPPPRPYGMPPVYGMAPPPYSPPGYGPPGGPPGMGEPPMGPDDVGLPPPPTQAMYPGSYPAMHPPGVGPAPSGPPLPRPRPAELAARDARATVVKPADKANEPPAIKPDIVGKPDAAPKPDTVIKPEPAAGKPETKPSAAVTPPAAPAAPAPSKPRAEPLPD